MIKNQFTDLVCSFDPNLLSLTTKGLDPIKSQDLPEPTNLNKCEDFNGIMKKGEK